jgi:hypothetical protein
MELAMHAYARYEKMWWSKVKEFYMRIITDLITGLA